MEDLFPRAKAIGLGEVRTWLPDGVQRGKEWVTRDPNRASKNMGEFSINLENGKWANFAAGPDARGNDAVSLYAYIFEAELSSEAGKYKNYQSGLQTAAAKEILIKYDHTYFPSADDEFKVPAKSKAGFWDGYRQESRGLETPPDLDLTWYEKKWGECSARWEFRANGKTVMYVCRFLSGKIKNGKAEKEDRPFTLWTDGKEYKWRSKAPEVKYPLWNNEELFERPNDPVSLHEGQKDASIMKIAALKYVCVGWFGGSNAVDKQDWEPMRGREVWYQFDGDASGRKTIGRMKKIAGEYDMILHIVYPPAGVKKGWSIADEVENGITEEWIEEIYNAEKQDKEERFLDDDNVFDFEILGYSGDDIVFYPHGKKKVTKYKASALTKGALMTLQDRSRYGDVFGKDEGGIAWDTAVNYIIRIAEAKPIFKHSKIRGTGVWLDSGKIVINTGEYLLVDGNQQPLHYSPGEFIYEKDKFIPYCKEEAITTEEASKVSDMMDLIDFKHKVYCEILVGWMTVAPFGGAVKWKSYGWLVGPTGAGKTHILSRIVNPLCADRYGIFARGSSTPAGIRNKLSNNSILTVIDEMESDVKTIADKIDEILRIFREGSSDSGAVTLHGTSDGEGREWIVQSMALFASIGASMNHGADKNRFTQIVLDSPYSRDQREREKRFQQLEKAEEILTPIYCDAFHTRTYELFDEVLESIDIIGRQVAEIMGSKRSGDQIGTLLAGAWMNKHDKAPSAAEAMDWLESLKIEEVFGTEKGKSDEELVLDEILTSRVEISGEGSPIRCTVGAALMYWWNQRDGRPLNGTDDLVGTDINRVKKDLEQYGIKPGDEVIDIAKDHPAIRKMLRETPWSNTYNEMLGRLSFCEEKVKGPGYFAGIAKRFRRLKAKEIFDFVPF